MTGTPMTVERAFLLAAPIVGVLMAGGYFVNAYSNDTPRSDPLTQVPEPDSWQVSGEEVTDMVRASVVATGGTVKEFTPQGEPQNTAAVSQQPAEPVGTQAEPRHLPLPKKTARPALPTRAPQQQAVAPQPVAPQVEPQQAAVPQQPAPQRAAAKPAPQRTASRPDATQPQRQANVQPQQRPRQQAVIEPPRVSQLPPPPSAEPEMVPPPPREAMRREERGIVGRSWDTVTRTTGAVAGAAIATPGTVWRATTRTVDAVVDIIPGTRRSSND